MHVAIAQLNQVVGDLRGNARCLAAAIDEGRGGGAALVVTPDLSLPGYPPEALLWRPAFLAACARELAALATRVHGVTALVGYPEVHHGVRHNAVAVIRDGAVAQVYRKAQLPNYTVFDEQRYFEPDGTPCVFDVDGVRCAAIICEDVWFPAPAARAKVAGAQLIVLPNAPPDHTHQQALRREQGGARAQETALPIVYVNRAGGQDELVFDAPSSV